MAPRTRPPNYGEFVTLKEYVESRIKAVEKGIEVANRSMQERLSGMNEFRDTLKDQAALFATRKEMETKFDGVERDIKDLQLSRATLDGKASQQTANIIMAIAIIGLVLSAVSLFLK